MNDGRRATYQQERYEDVYRETENCYGFPDRKICDGRVLNGARVLSIGCGIGNDVWHLAKDNHVVGIDFAYSGLAVAGRHGLDGAVCDLNSRAKLPFYDGAFDVVVCKDILEHLLEPLAILREVKRVLNDRGYAVINVPNHFYLPMRLRLLFGKGLTWRSFGSDHREEYDEWNYMHIRFFTYRGFQKFLKSAGFKPTRFYWDFGTLAHYCNPDMWLEPQLWKQRHGLPLSRRGAFGVRVIGPLWRFFNILLPRTIRSFIVSLSPGLLCACFYAYVEKEFPSG